MKANIQLITAAVLSIGGLVLLFCGVYIAPQGEIHESLLVGFGEVATFAGALFRLSSCNVTRTVTTRSEAWQRGDTSVVIQTKTIETYDASKKGL